MEAIEEKKKALALKKSRIEAQEKMLREKERKLRTRRLIELGGLVVKSNIEGLNNNALLGALLEIKDQMNEREAIERWKDKGDAAFEADRVENGEALTVSFELEPPREAKSILRDLGLKWNRFRKEWQGYAQKERVEKELKEFSPTVESVE